MRLLFFLLLARSVFAGLWYDYLLYVRIEAHGVTRCGKQYRPGQPLVSPAWAQFPLPLTTTTPQLALRCNPALIPFLPDDLADNSFSLIIVDALVRYKEIAGAQPLILPVSPDAELSVTVTIDGMPLTSGTVSLNGSVAIPFSLSRNIASLGAVFPGLLRDAVVTRTEIHVHSHESDLPPIAS
jgi:hypothetical protein